MYQDGAYEVVVKIRRLVDNVGSANFQRLTPDLLMKVLDSTPIGCFSDQKKRQKIIEYYEARDRALLNIFHTAQTIRDERLAGVFQAETRALLDKQVAEFEKLADKGVEE